MKLNKAARLIFSVAALLLGNVLANAFGSPVFFLLGEVIESGETEQIFSSPADKRTEDYITGRFG